MTAPKGVTWELDPHTKAKHEILKSYLGAWFNIVGPKFKSILYIDGYAGPGRYKGGELGSPLITLNYANAVAKRCPQNEFNFLFIEKDIHRVRHLLSEIDALTLSQNIKINIKHSEFNHEIEDILNDLSKYPSTTTPVFAFIDPFGFSDFCFDRIQSYLKNPSTEIFINIMSSHAHRFSSVIPETMECFFGLPDYKSKLDDYRKNFEDPERELYLYQLRTVAKFVKSFRINIRKKTYYYDLIFATNNPLGYRKMKEVFWSIDPSGAFSFSEEVNNQSFLFSFDGMLIPTVQGLIKEKFIGMEDVTCKQIFDFVEEETIFRTTHARQALKNMEESFDVSVKLTQSNGKPRRSGTFTESTILDFLPF